MKNCIRRLRLFPLIFAASITVFGQLSRREIVIPDIPGYITLKADLHVHTVFSDGMVWPSVRVEEAWHEGLDVIAITDHIEYRPHKDVAGDHNRSFELAQNTASAYGILLIRGCEITRDMPPGHFNAIFIRDANTLDEAEYRDALKAAMDQGAFITWNHPGWLQPNEIPIWYEEHTELLKKGMIHGIEIVNERAYYPLAYQWALEKDLSILGCSDIHDPTLLFFDYAHGEHRPVTLIFVKERSIEAVKEALFQRRTVVYKDNFLFGQSEFLYPIIEESIEIKTGNVEFREGRRNWIQIHNKSDIDYQFELSDQVEGLEIPSKTILLAGKTVRLSLRATQVQSEEKRQLKLKYRVTNCMVAPDEPLEFTIVLESSFIINPAE